MHYKSNASRKAVSTVVSIAPRGTNGDFRRLGSDERSSPLAKSRRGPSERARANHWAGSLSRHRALGAADEGFPL